MMPDLENHIIAQAFLRIGAVVVAGLFAFALVWEWLA